MPLLKYTHTHTHIYIYIYIYTLTNISIPGPATNHSPENGLNHMHIIECPNDHKICPSLEFWSSLQASRPVGRTIDKYHSLQASLVTLLRSDS